MKIFSGVGSTDGKDDCTSSKDGEDNYAPCSPETPIDNDVLAEISFVREVMAGVNFGEDQKNVSYIVLNIFFLGYTIWSWRLFWEVYVRQYDQIPP